MPATPSIRQVKIRQKIVIAVFTLGLAIFGFIVHDDINQYFGVDPQVTLITVGILALLGVAIFLMLYLRGDIMSPHLGKNTLAPDRQDDQHSLLAIDAIKAETRDQIDLLQREVSHLQARLAAGPGMQGGATLNNDQILESLRWHVTQNLAAEVESRVEQRLRDNMHATEVRQILAAASQRLSLEIESLTRRGNVNLLIGVATTTMAVSVLVYMVLNISGSFDSWPALLSHYIPRVTTVIFIEVFSFFFLRLYRKSLSEIKYYQNELTTLDAQHVALAAASQLDDTQARISVIETICNTDRNRGRREAKPASTGSHGTELTDMAELLEKVTKVAVSAVKKSGAKSSKE